jgi:uncharacterized membrane protein YgcG
VAVGKQLLSDDERRRIEAAVQKAESHTGMQFLIYLGKSKRDTRAHAEKVLTGQGYHQLQGVLIFISPHRRALEVVTSEAARNRISDEQAQRAVDIMLPAMRQSDWVSGIELGLAALAEDAGPLPAGQAPAPDLPDIM